MEVKQQESSLVFLNKPIYELNEDVIGFSAQIDKLDAAISSEAQMIAITAPFGGGKSSVVELLRKKYEDNPNRKVINVTMWSNLSKELHEKKDVDEKEKSTTKKDTDERVISNTIELHRSFLYQVISQIDPKRGSYVAKKINRNYGNIEVKVKSKLNCFLGGAAILLYFLGKILPDGFSYTLPIFSNHSNAWNSMMVVTSICFALIVIVKSGILFLSTKSEGKRNVDFLEIIELYKEYVINEEFWDDCTDKYIVVIEDLDRTNDSKAVLHFLQELRKYYICDGENKVVLIATVKPEAVFLKDMKLEEDFKGTKYSLYDKLFDYILNLQTINIDDYDAVLTGILEINKEEIFKTGIAISERLIDIQGMQWIIRGKKLGIREIKERLNMAFLTYESLKSKFLDNDNISFERCAIAAYITTEFEKDFYATEDNAFQDLVDSYLQKKSNKEVQEEGKTEYDKTIQELVRAGHIDGNYRMYFYNYPKGSKIYSKDETIVQKAILYDTVPNDLDDIVRNVVINKSTIIFDSLNKVKLLGLQLPNSIFKSEALYVETFQLARNDVYDWLKALNYSVDSLDKTINIFKELLHFDSNRVIYQREEAYQFCLVWEEKFDEPSLLKMRKMLCEEFNSEIIWYKSLFEGEHSLINFEEMGNLKLEDIFYLVNLKHSGFSIDTVKYILERFEKERNEETEVLCENFLRLSFEYIENEAIAPMLIQYMYISAKIVPDFETIVITVIDKLDSAEEHEKLFRSYQEVINKVSDNLSNQTVKNINHFDYFDGYTDMVTNQMMENGYIFDYALQLFSCHKKIEFENEKINDAFREKIEWLLERETTFLSLRESLLQYESLVFSKYEFMFGSDCPVMTPKEFEILSVKKDVIDIEVIPLLPPSLITEEQVPQLVRFFCRKKQDRNSTIGVLSFVSAIENPCCEKIFFTLDFDQIIYRQLSKENKETIKEKLKEKLQLESITYQLRFMEATKCLDATWEEAMLEELKANKDFREDYIAIVNKARISNKTIDVICRLGHFYSLKEEVTEKLYKENHYKEYVISTALRRKSFKIEEGDRENVLWPVYEEIFRKGAYSIIISYMEKNRDFLERIMLQRLYIGAVNDSLFILSALPQDSECVKEAFSRGSEFAISYFTKVKEFKDYDAAKTFLKYAFQDATLLSSDEVYNNVHSKLGDRILKGNYTNKRNRKK